MDEDNRMKYLKNPNRKQKRLYFLKLLENVVMTGIPQIVTEHNFKRRVFKLLVLFACLFGFFFQLSEYLILYFTYPTTLELFAKFEEEKYLPKPIVTICDLNGIRRRAFCRDFPENCKSPENITNFCQKYGYFCRKENLTEADLMFPNENTYFNYDYNRSIIEEYGVRAEDILKSYKNITEHIIYSNEIAKLRNCYMINLNHYDQIRTINEDPEKEFFMMYLSDTNTIGDIMMKFNPEEKFRPTVPIGAKVSIHSIDQLINPFIDGFVVQPNKRYIIQLKVIENNLLTGPYKTNCTHYDQIKSKFFGQNYTRQLCFIECKKKISIKECGCISPEYPFDTEDEFCSDYSFQLCINKLNLDTCYDKCRTACHYTVFKYEVYDTPIEFFKYHIPLESPNDEEYRERLSVMNFFYKRPEVLIYKYKPKFQSIELFSYIGGYIGIWLGISLIAICDFLQVIFVYIYHIIMNKIPITGKN